MLTTIRYILSILFLVLIALLLKADRQITIATAAPAHQPLPALNGRPAVNYLKEHGLYDRLQTTMEASQYEIASAPRARLPQAMKAAGEIYLASNPSQHLQAYFGAGQMVLKPAPSAGQGGWQAALKLQGAGYGARVKALPASSIRVSGNRVEILHDLLTEWYVNTKEGIEQGFTLRERPGLSFGSGPLRLALAVTGDVKAKLEDDGQAVVLLRRDGKQALRYDHLVAYDALGQVLPARMEVSSIEISLVVEDAAAVYPVTIDPLFTQVQKLTASDGMREDLFGYSVGISGDTIVVGAFGKNSKTGAVYIYDRNQGGADNWGQVKKLQLSDGTANDYFGATVGISDDTVIVGAEAKGAAYIFKRNQGGTNNWGQVKKLTPSESTPYDSFGATVGISADTVVVGTPSKNTATGEAYIFSRNQGGTDNWGQVQKLTASDAAILDFFGSSVGISNGTVVIGAYGKNSFSGAAYIFARNQGGADNWAQVQKLTASDGTTGDQFGEELGINGDTVVVGAYGKNSFTGAAYVFGRNHGGANNWGQIKKLVASDGMASNGFGASFGISNDVIVVGSPFKNSAISAAYVFGRNHGGANNWGQVQKLTRVPAANRRDFPFETSFGKAA